MPGKKPVPDDKQRKLALIERRMLGGLTSTTELARTLDMPLKSVDDYKRIIFDRWKTEPLNGRDEAEKREMNCRRLEYIMYLAAKEFARSKEPQEEVTIKRQLCPECGGEGRDEVTPGEYVPCATCLGEGRTLMETRKVTQRLGDPRYLKVMKDCVESTGKFDGTIKPDTRQAVALMKSSKEVGGEIEETAWLVFEEAPADQVLRCLQVFDEVVHAAEERGDIIEGELVES